MGHREMTPKEKEEIKNNDPPLQTLIPYSNYMVTVSHSDVG